jgi:chemotaxis methyl-accepting protein methylase
MANTKPDPHVYDANLNFDADLQEFFENDSLVIATRFFRNKELFAQLVNQIVPEMVERGLSTPDELRIWSAGCSDGRETYSLVMAVRKKLDELGHSNVRILARGSDLNRTLIDKARRGNYSISKNDLSTLEPYKGFFSHTNETNWQVNSAIMRQAQFYVEDITHENYEQKFDILVCSLVILYYHPDIQKIIIKQLLESLQPDGYFFVAPVGRKWLKSVGYAPIPGGGPFFGAI